jgi:hypothetical protein
MGIQAPEKILCKRFPRHLFPYNVFDIATRNEIMFPLLFFAVTKETWNRATALTHQ